MAIFVPPAIFDVEDAVLNLPMMTNVSQQVFRANATRVFAGNKVPRLRKHDVALGIGDVAIDTQQDFTTGEAQLFANVLRVLQVQPQPAAIGIAPLFSTVIAAGGCSWAAPKHCCIASRTSP